MDEIAGIIRRIVREELQRAEAARQAPVPIASTPAPVVCMPSPDGGPRTYSVATVAERLEVSKVWVYDRIKAGELAVVEFGSTRPKQRITAEALQAFIESRSFGAPRDRAR